MNHSEDPLNEKEAKNGVRSPIKPLFDKFANHKDVSLIYGEPISYENQRVVPVAKMSYSFGAGSGATNADKEEAFQDQGEGGGGHISVRPLGVYEMTADRVRFKPVLDLKYLTTLFAVLSFGVIVLLRKR